MRPRFGPTREEVRESRRIARTLPYSALHVPEEPEEPATVRELVWPYWPYADEDECPPTERCPESPRVIERPIEVLVKF